MIYKIINKIFEIVDLYLINLKDYQILEENENIDFLFQILNHEDVDRIRKFSLKRGEKYLQIVKKRLIYSRNYKCFGFIHKTTGRIAHTRWLCVDEFYSDILKDKIIFLKDEAFTLDSYTHPDYRHKGLHKEMNVRMLNYLKSNSDYNHVYIMIRWFYPHLHKIVKQLGYRRLRTIIRYKSGSFNSLLKRFSLEIKMLYNRYR